MLFYCFPQQVKKKRKVVKKERDQWWGTGPKKKIASAKKEKKSFWLGTRIRETSSELGENATNLAGFFLGGGYRRQDRSE